jgi:stress-induced morphogen
MKFLNTSDVKSILTEAFPGASVEVSDMTGTSDHFQITVVSQAFAGKSLIDQHKMVFAVLDKHMADGNGIHAVKLKTRAQ